MAQIAPVFITLDDPLAAFGTFAQGLNNNGQIVGYYTDGSSVKHGFLYGDGTYTTIDDLAKSGNNRVFSDTLLEDINDNGVIVGYSLIAGGFGPSGPQKFTASGFTGPITGNYPNNGAGGPALGTNNQNQVVGYYDGIFFSGAQQRNGFLSSSGNVTTVDFPKAQQTEAHAINNLGQVVGTWVGTDSNVSGVTSHGFFYNSGAYSFFDDPFAVNGTFAEGINNANLIVGYYIDGNAISHGYVFNRTTGTYTTIDVPGATQTLLTGINDAGQIVGYYNDTSGHTHSFLYADPPPPSNNDEWQLSNGHWAASVDPGTHPSGANLAAAGDFNHDGTSDVLWLNPNGDVDEWLIGANGKWAGSVDIGIHPGSGWQITGSGDFNGDGTSDVLWFNPGSNQTDIWQLSNGHWAASTTPGAHPGGYQIGGIGDTDHDGTSDIVWFNPNSGDVDNWKIVNGKWAGSTNIGLHPGAGWQVGTVADFNHDGTSDVLFFNPSTGQTDIWLLQNGRWSASVSPGSHPLGYTVLGAGDVNHDGTNDIIWFNPSTDDVDEWLIANGKWAGSVGVGSHPGTGWVPALGDFNHDGTTDVFWHNPLL